MISANLIERALDARDFDRLLRELSGNGLALPLSLRMQLAQSETATIALGLRRLVELTYGPTAQSRRLTERLLDAQHEDGGFDGGEGPDLLTTVLTLAALARVAADHTPTRVSKARQQEYDRIVAALSRGFAALAELQDCDGLFTASNDRTLADRAMTTAFIVSLLGQESRFRGSVRLHDIHRWFEDRDGRLDRTTRQLWDLASVCIDDHKPLASLAA